MTMGRDFFDESRVDLVIHRPSEPDYVSETFRALPDRGQFHVDGVSTDVRTGDFLAQRLDTGREIYFEVDRVTRYPGGDLSNTTLEITEVQRVPASTAVAAEQPVQEPLVTWPREVLVLRTVLALMERRRPGHEVRVDEICEATGLSADDVERSLAALEPEMVDDIGRGGAGTIWAVRRVTAEGRRKAEVWPDDAQIAARRVFDAVAELARDDEIDPDLQAAAARLHDAISSRPELGVDVYSRALARALDMRINDR